MTTETSDSFTVVHANDLMTFRVHMFQGHFIISKAFKVGHFFKLFISFHLLFPWLTLS